MEKKFEFEEGFDIEEFAYEDEFVKRRIYQLKNHEEVYKGYENYQHNLERSIAVLELEVMKLCNYIFQSDPNDPEVLFDLVPELSHMLWGCIDTEALNLMARCDTKKSLPEIHGK